MKISAAILAGGRARRMNGEDKALLEVGGQPILLRQLTVLRPLFTEILVVAGNPQRYQQICEGPKGLAEQWPRPILERPEGLPSDGAPGATQQIWDPRGIRLVTDREADRGPLAGIDAAFAASEADALVVFGCDLPFLDERLVKLVRDHSPAQAVVPRVADRPQALHARYARSVTPLIRARLDRGERRLLGLLDELEVAWLGEPVLRAIDATLRGLTNVNTPEELAAARSS